MTDKQELKGLGGWLLLVGFGVLGRPILMLFQYAPMYFTMFTDGSLAILSDPSYEYYIEWSVPLVFFEFGVNILLFIASCWLIYLFFAKHYLFPKVFSIILLVSLAYLFVNSWLASIVFPETPMFDEYTTTELVRLAIYSAIWIPYMMKSKRVANTFVEHRPASTNQNTEATPTTSV